MFSRDVVILKSLGLCNWSFPAIIGLKTKRIYVNKSSPVEHCLCNLIGTESTLIRLNCRRRQFHLRHWVFSFDRLRYLSPRLCKKPGSPLSPQHNLGSGWQAVSRLCESWTWPKIEGKLHLSRHSLSLGGQQPWRSPSGTISISCARRR